jgi:thiol:disulfide interchange protein
VYVSALTAKSWTSCQESPDNSCHWFYEYDKALAHAKEYKKPILVDVGAPYCSLCKAIDKKVLTPETLENCQEYCVFVKVDGSDENHAVHAPLLKKYSVMGAPTLLLIDQENEQEITRWGGELYQKSGKEFTEQVKSKTKR